MTIWYRVIQASRCAMLVSVGAIVACSNDQLPPAQLPVATQLIQLVALSSADTLSPTAYDMVTLQPVRFGPHNADLVFDIGPDRDFGLGTTGDTIAVLLPAGLPQAQPAGLQRSSVAFDSIRVAPDRGYISLQPTQVATGDVLLAASRPQLCDFNIHSPRYAKLQVLSIDFATRSTVIRAVIDPNCGYRGLGHGIPTF